MTRIDPYVSRKSSREEIAPRVDPVVWGNEEGPLSRRELQGYEEDGYLILDRHFDAGEVQRLRDGIDRLIRAQRNDPETVVREPDSHVVRSIFRPHRHDSDYAAITEDPRLMSMARQILGSPVYVHQCRVNIKPAIDGREFSWHSDFETWHIEDGMPRVRAVSASVMLEDNDDFNGPLLVVPGSHHYYVRCVGGTPDNHYRSSLRRQVYGVPSAEALRVLSRDRGLVSCKGAVGSVVLFDANLMHASAGNLSPRSRSNVFIVYNSVENRLQRPFGGQAPRPAFLAEDTPRT